MKADDPRNATNALSWLIDMRRQELGLTWTELAKRGGMAHSVLYTLYEKTHHAQVPRPKTCAQVAAALDVPEGVVRACAGSAAGFSAFDEAFRRQVQLKILEHHLEQLPREDQEKIARMTCALAGKPYPLDEPRGPGHVDI